MTFEGQIMLMRVEFHLAREYGSAMGGMVLSPLAGRMMNSREALLATDTSPFGPMVLLVSWGTVRSLRHGGKVK